MIGHCMRWSFYTLDKALTAEWDSRKLKNSRLSTDLIYFCPVFASLLYSAKASNQLLELGKMPFKISGTKLEH